jgi:uncharacterized Zn-binding protein involved in type VI secretion
MKTFQFPYPYSTIPVAPYGVKGTAASSLNYSVSGDAILFSDNWLQETQSNQSLFKILFFESEYSGILDNYQSVYSNSSLDDTAVELEDTVTNFIKYNTTIYYPSLVVSEASPNLTVFSSYFSENSSYSGPYEFDGFTNIHSIPAFTISAQKIDYFFYGFAEKTLDFSAFDGSLVRFGVLIDGLSASLIVDGTVIDSVTLGSDLTKIEFPTIDFLSDLVDGYVNKVPSGITITLNETESLVNSAVTPIDTYEIGFFTAWTISEFNVGSGGLNLTELFQANPELNLTQLIGEGETSRLIIKLPGFSTNPVPDNAAPVISSTAPTEFTNGIAFSYQVTVTDEEAVSFNLVDFPTEATISPTGLITWLPDSSNSTESFTLTVTDAAGLVDTQSFEVTKVIIPITITSTPTLIKATQTDYLYQIETNFLVGVTFEVVSGPSGMAVNSAGLVTWTTPDVIDDYDVTVKASITGSEDTQSFSIHVYRPIQITEGQSFEFPISTALSYTVLVNETLTTKTFSFVANPQGLEINSTSGLITWGGSSTKKSFDFTVRVEDEYGFDEQTYHVEVFVPIQFTCSPPTEDYFLFEDSFSFLPSINATGTTVTYSLTAKPTTASINPTNGAINWVVIDELGSITFTIQATDEFSVDEFTFTILTLELPWISTVETVPNVFMVGDQLLFHLEVPEGYLTTLATYPSGMTLQNNTITWTAAYYLATVEVSVVVYHPQFPELSDTFYIVESRVFKKPLFISSPPEPLRIAIGSTWSYNYIIADTPENATGFWVLESTFDGSGQIVEENNTITFTPTNEGTYPVEITLRIFSSSGGGTVIYEISQSFALEAVNQFSYSLSGRFSAVRAGDLTTGHGKYPPQAAFAGSENVFINGMPAMRAFDDWDGHSCSSPECYHDGTVIMVRNRTVFVNGLPLVTVGDALDCGSICAEGSPDVIVGGE